MRSDIRTLATNHANIENIYSLKKVSSLTTQSKLKGENNHAI